MAQFLNDLENGKFDREGDANEAEGHDRERESPKEGSTAPEGRAADEPESPTKPEEDFGTGLENEEEAADNAGDVKNDANGKASYDSKPEKDEVSVLPEGNQVMIRTIPPDIGRVKLETVSLASSLKVEPMLTSM